MEQIQYETVGEIAAQMKLSTDTVVRLFENEPGVQVLQRPSRFKRRYRTLRVPTHVKNRVIDRMTVK